MSLGHRRWGWRGAGPSDDGCPLPERRRAGLMDRRSSRAQLCPDRQPTLHAQVSVLLCLEQGVPAEPPSLASLGWAQLLLPKTVLGLRSPPRRGPQLGWGIRPRRRSPWTATSCQKLGPVVSQGLCPSAQWGPGSALGPQSCTPSWHQTALQSPIRAAGSPFCSCHPCGH